MSPKRAIFGKMKNHENGKKIVILLLKLGHSKSTLINKGGYISKL